MTCRSALREHAAQPNISHAGLLLAAYYDGPPPTADRVLDPEAKKKLLSRAQQAAGQAAATYKLAFERWVGSFEERQKPKLYQTLGRLILGLGEHTILETGLTLHHTYGVPYIPGSALKGLAYHYFLSVWCNKSFEKELDQEQRKVKKVLFGETESAGYITFHDAWIDPASVAKALVPDVLTPHHGKYYMGEQDLPSDYG